MDGVVAGRETRVAIVVPGLPQGGGVSSVARFLCRLLEGKEGYEPELVSMATSSRDTASVRLLHPRSWLSGIRVTEGRWNDRSYRHVGSWFAEFEFMRYAPRRRLTRLLDRADLVHVVAGAPSWVLAATRCRRPVFLSVATLTARERERRHQVERGAVAAWRRLMTSVTSRLDRLGLAAPDRVFVMNRWMRGRAESARGRNGVVTAPPGVDVCRFRPPDAGDAPIDQDYILSVARFGDPRKNAELLIEAYARLRKRNGSCPDLWLAGKSPPPESAMRIATDLGVSDAIRILGRVSDAELPHLYRNARLFVLSSDEEGFGLVLIEAMASGTPVVSTACGGPEDIVTDGQDGFLVPVGDWEALAKAMGRIALGSGLCSAMGRRARRKAVERYSLHIAGRPYVREYEAILADTDANVPGTRPERGRRRDSRWST